jgi:hypothetical protein
MILKFLILLLVIAYFFIGVCWATVMMFLVKDKNSKYQDLTIGKWITIYVIAAIRWPQFFWGKHTRGRK